MSSLFLPSLLGETTCRAIGADRENAHREALQAGRAQGEIWLGALRIGVPARYVTFSNERIPAMNKTLPPSAIVRAALESRRVREELPEPHRATVRARVMRDAEFGVHWLWRGGAEHYTSAGLRYLADAYSREADAAATVVCRRLADELDARNAEPESALGTTRSTSDDAEADFRVKRWDLRGDL